MTPTALTIAGSDPSGGAGIAADLKTFSRLKVYGMAVITALTAQNTERITHVMEVPPEFVAAQFEAVVTDIPPAAVKTGMLPGAGTIEVLSGLLRRYQLRNLVVDPVMVSTSGTRLMNREALDALCRFLLPLALIVTPNIAEAAILAGRAVSGIEDMEEAALRIHDFGCRFVYLKGGHLQGPATDVLFDGKEFTRLSHERLAVTDDHGTGCVLSAAVAGYLARGATVLDAVTLAKKFVSEAIRHGLRLGQGRGPCDAAGIRAEEESCR